MALCVSLYSIPKNKYRKQQLKSYLGVHISLFFSTAQRIYCSLMRMQQDVMQGPSDGSEFRSCIPDSLFPSYVPLSPKLLDTQFPQMSIYFSGWR